MARMIYEFNMKVGGAVVGDSAAQNVIRDLFMTGVIPEVLRENSQYFNGITRIDVDCVHLINWVRVLVHNGRVPLENVRILCEGVDCGLDRNGRLRHWPNLMCISDGYLMDLLNPKMEDDFYLSFKRGNHNVPNTM